MSKWPTVKLADICTTSSGGTPSRAVNEYYDGEIPWVKSGELTDGYVSNVSEYITESGLKNSSAKLIPKGTLLIAMYGATVGKLGILEMDASTNQAICAIRTGPRVDRDYLFQYLLSERKNIVSSGVGGAQPNISQEKIRNLEIPLPPLDEQRRIAAFLDKADALRQKRRQAIAKLDELAQATFLEMFGDPVTNPMGWEIRTLGQIIVYGPQNGLYKPSSDYGTGTPILRIDSFYDGSVTNLDTLKRVRISESEKKLFKISNGDILINRVNSRSHLGKSALINGVTEDTVFESNMMRFKHDEKVMTGKFLIHFLQTEFIKQQIAHCAKDAVNQSSINQQDVKNFRIAIPPLSLQKKFTEAMQKIECNCTQQASALEEKEKLFASLQNSAFSGEV